MHPFREMAFIVVARFDGHTIYWPRPDGNPFPYDRKVDAFRRAAQLNAGRRKMKPMTITLQKEGEEGTFDLKVDDPAGLRFTVCDWLTQMEVH